MKTFTNGLTVKLNVANANILNYRQFDGIIATVDFQCREILGVAGLVYVNFIPKGKRKMHSIALHADQLEII